MTGYGCTPHDKTLQLQKQKGIFKREKLKSVFKVKQINKL